VPRLRYPQAALHGRAFLLATHRAGDGLRTALRRLAWYGSSLTPSSCTKHTALNISAAAFSFSHTLRTGACRCGEGRALPAVENGSATVLIPRHAVAGDGV